jgi:hypothetical protein
LNKSYVIFLQIYCFSPIFPSPWYFFPRHFKSFKSTLFHVKIVKFILKCNEYADIKGTLFYVEFFLWEFVSNILLYNFPCLFYFPLRETMCFWIFAYSLKLSIYYLFLNLLDGDWWCISFSYGQYSWCTYTKEFNYKSKILIWSPSLAINIQYMYLVRKYQIICRNVRNR